ncbi:MAG: hypothetical protein J2P13_11800 [Acidobacteria bacterium]|nr:hypothetical protein [Acidobacteriota bacterium]
MAFNDSSAPRHLHVELALTPLTKAREPTPFVDASAGRIRGTTADFDRAPNSIAIYEVK